MKPPKPFDRTPRRPARYQMCHACREWHEHLMMFKHDGITYILCEEDYGDYWENMDTRPFDLKVY